MTTRDGQDDIDGYHNVKMEGGWCRLCELEESYIKDVQIEKKGVVTSLLDILMRPSCCLDQVEKHKKGGGVQGLGLKPLHPCFKIKRATDKG